MKIYTSLLCGAMLCAGLASCEMKDEILGDKGTSGAVGYLDMSVAVDAALENIQTKADSEETVGTGQQADGFLVELTGPNNYTNSFTYQSDMEPIALPVGEGYEAYAHSNIEGGLQKKMTVPFYGARESFNITESINSTINIACVAENTKFQLIYDTEFTAMYKQWEITVTAGLNESGCSETYEYDSATDGDTPQNPAPIYFYLADEVKSFLVNINATTREGNIPVHASKSFPKEDNSAYTGGEAVQITMLPGDPDATINGQASIEIDVELFSPYEDINEPIQIEGEEPTTPEEPGTGPEEPEEPTPGDGEITISDNGTGYLTNGVTATKGGPYPTDVAVVMDVPKGIKSVYVLASSGNQKFNEALGLLGNGALVTGDGMDLASDAAKDLESLFALPAANATDYTFKMSDTLFGMLGNFVGEHGFTLKVVDQDGNESSAILKITINQ